MKHAIALALVIAATPAAAGERPFWEWFSHSVQQASPAGGDDSGPTTRSVTSQDDVNVSVSNGGASASASASHTGQGQNSGSVSVGAGNATSSASATSSGGTASASVHGTSSAHAGGP